VTQPKKLRPGRYPDEAIAALLEAKRKASGDTVEQMADIIGLAASSWYKKVDGVTPFKVSEIGRAAEHWGMPPGWPFLQVDTSQH
jgi:hypothetical protein